MKKALAIILLTLLTFCLASCSSGKTTVSSDTESSSQTNIKVVSSETPSSTVTTVKVAKVTADSLNVRKEASTDSEVLTVAVKDQYFLVQDDTGTEGWIKIKYNDSDAFISSDYAEVSTVTEDEAKTLISGGTVSADNSSDSTAASSSSSDTSSAVTAGTTRSNEDGEKR